jgi:hypothetical protein
MLFAEASRITPGNSVTLGKYRKRHTANKDLGQIRDKAHGKQITLEHFSGS